MRASSVARTLPSATRFAFLLGLAAPGCVTDSVPQDIHSEAPPGSSPMPAPAGLAQDGAAPPTRAPLSGSDDELAADEGASTAAAPGAGANLAPLEGSSAGACDLRGHWLITQRTIASGLGVKQRAAWWFYYEIDQAGEQLSVKRGLVCGSQVFPVDPLSAAVELDASFAALSQRNSHAGRRGTVVALGESCNVSFERAVIVLGATTPFYLDESNPLPNLDQPATDTTPGWEDWDEDGNPAVSLHVSGLVTGTRYTALRAFTEWDGTIPAAATAFLLSVPGWGQEEAVLGVTAEVLKQTGVPDADRSGHFTEFARLTPQQAGGDIATLCATVRQLAPTLTPDANR